MVEDIAQVAPPPRRRFGIWFLLGLVFLPYVACWFLLRRGYTAAERLLGFGWAAIAILVLGLSPKTAPSPPAPTPDPVQQARGLAAAEARAIVPKFMRDPSSAQFGRVWGMAPHIACGTVNGKNAFGALAGQQQFVYAAGSVEFDDGSRNFARHWNTLCVDKLLTAAPHGVMGHRWGSRPTGDLRPFAPPAEGLALYVPRNEPAPFEGVPVKEADYRFDHGRLYAGDLYIDGQANRDAVKAALSKKYGPPLSADDGTHAYQWQWPERHVAIEMSYDDKSARTQVTIAEGAH